MAFQTCTNICIAVRGRVRWGGRTAPAGRERPRHPPGEAEGAPFLWHQPVRESWSTQVGRRGRNETQWVSQISSFCQPDVKLNALLCFSWCMLSTAVWNFSFSIFKGYRFPSLTLATLLLFFQPLLICSENADRPAIINCHRMCKIITRNKLLQPLLVPINSKITTKC